jgi:hypothetical protein
MLKSNNERHALDVQTHNEETCAGFKKRIQRATINTAEHERRDTCAGYGCCANEPFATETNTKDNTHDELIRYETTRQQLPGAKRESPVGEYTPQRCAATSKYLFIKQKKESKLT